MLNVHLCSKKGIWLFADKRLWKHGPKEDAPDEMPIYLYSYEESYPWQPIAQEFDKSFSDWPGSVRSEWPGAEGVSPNTSLERTRER